MRQQKTLREKIENRIARKRGDDVFLPREFRDLLVPEALMSGDHAAIEKWRAAERERRTKERK